MRLERIPFGFLLESLISQVSRKKEKISFYFSTKTLIFFLGRILDCLFSADDCNFFLLLIFDEIQ